MVTKKRLLMTLLLAVLTVEAAPLFAQEQVTVVRRSGESVSGRFEDWVRQTDTVYVRVTPNDQRQFRMGDVLLIDVGGTGTNLPANETQAAQGAEHILVTRRGDVMTGRLVSIEGGEGSAHSTEPRRVSFTAGGREQRLLLSEVARIYLGNYRRPTAAATEPAPAAPNTAVPEGSIRVPANQQWTATNITIGRNDRVLFTPEGEIQLSGEADDKATANGSLKGRTAPNAPMPGVLAGALIGRIGNGAPFAIGNQSVPLPMTGQGPLWLGINDDAVGDNTGALVVRIIVTRGR
ncbi:MAG: hypothetical protein Q8L75_19435 [Acidobacteriota bacterium]|nr:hypothetical protein [Acidobacteriota bacterium]